MDKYLYNNLQYNEEILLEPRLHWSIYIDRYFYFSLVFAGFCLFMNLIALDIPFFQQFFWHAEAFIGAVVLLRIIYVWLHNYSVDMVVTNYRVIYKSGFIDIKTEELENKRIESVEVRQSFVGRLFNYGDILFSGTGTSKLAFRRVFAPWRVKELIAQILQSNSF